MRTPTSLAPCRGYPLGRRNAIRLRAGDTYEFPLERLDLCTDGRLVGGGQPTMLIERWSDGRRWWVEPEKPEKPHEASECRFTFSEPDAYRAKAFVNRDADRVLDAIEVPYTYFVVDPPHVSDIRMYTIIPAVSGMIDDWRAMLGPIQDMGFNAIQLLPVTEMGDSQSPYAASDLFSIDPSYSSAETPALRLSHFNEFVAEVRTRGMHLCLDLVLNHVAVGGRFALAHPEWIAEDPTEPDGVRRAGWDDGSTWNTWRDLALLNYEPFRAGDRDEMWAHMTEYALFWASIAAETDGIVRLDNLHSSYRPFMLHVLREIRRRYRRLIVLGELFNTEDRILATSAEYGLNLLLGTPWEHKFVPQLRRYLRYVHGMRGRLRYFFPITSHDSKSPAEEFGDPKSTVPRLVVSMLMGPGPTGIVQGVELGLQRRPDFIGPPAKVDLPIEHDFRELVRELTRLRTKHPEFCMAGNLLLVDDEHDAILAGLRLAPDTGLPLWLICANFDTTRVQSLTVDFTGVGADRRLEFRTALGTGQHTWNENRLTVQLPEASATVYHVESTPKIV